MLIEPNQMRSNALPKNGSQMDDNDAILRLLGKWYYWKDAAQARLDLGRERYGHGIRVEDDTTQWGTKTNSWLEMGLEEIDDLAIYVAAQLVRDTRGDFRSDVLADRVLEYHELFDLLRRARGQINRLIEDEQKYRRSLMEDNG